MKMHTFFLIALVFPAQPGQAQIADSARPDSLWQVWMDLSRPDSARLHALDRFIWEGPLRKRPDSALHLVRMLYDTAAHRGLQHQMISAIHMKGILMAQTGDHAAAIALYRQAMEMSRAIGDERGEGWALSNIGSSYYAMQEPWEALKYFTEAMEMARSQGMRARESELLHNMAVANANMGYADSSLAQTERSLQIAQEIGHERGILSALVMLGDNLRALGRPTQAEDHYQRAAVMAKRIGEPRMRADALFGSADIHADRKEWDRCIDKGREALALAEDIDNAFLTEQAYWHLARWNEQAGRYADALSALRANMRVHDQVRSDENKAALVRQKIQFDFDLKEAALHAEMENKAALASHRIQQQKTARNGILAGALLLLAGGGAWMYSDRKRRKERFHKEKAELETKVLRTQLNPHFIFNALNSINALVQRNDPEGASTYLAKFGRVMRGVLENSRHAEVALHDDLETLRGYIELERQRTKGKFDCTITVDPAINAAQVMVPPLMVQPLVENAIWHGLANKAGHGHIQLDIKQQGGQLIWSIEDDGVGRNAAVNTQDPVKAGSMGAKKTSLGSVITRGRLKLLQQQFGGSAGLRYEDLPQGTRAVVYMPLIAA